MKEGVHLGTIGTWVINWDDRLGGIKNWFNHKNWYLAGSIRAISNYISKTSRKSANMVSGSGINCKSIHYENFLMWIIFLANIHRQKVVFAVSFRNNLLQRLRQILDYLLKFKIFNLQGLCIGCNNLLVPKNIIFDGVQTWPYKGSTSIVTTNRSIKWIPVSVHIFGSHFSMLILTCCSSTCRVVRPSQSSCENVFVDQQKVHPHLLTATPCSFASSYSLSTQLLSSTNKSGS